MTYAGARLILEKLAMQMKGGKRGKKGTFLLTTYALLGEEKILCWNLFSQKKKPLQFCEKW